MQPSRRVLAGQLGAALRALCSAGGGSCPGSGSWARSRPFSTIPEPDDTHLYSEQLQSPHFVQPISINQLDALCRQPSLRWLSNSATFLKSQLPARLENHLHRLKALPRPVNPALQGLMDGVLISKRQGLEVASDWRLVDTSTAEGLHHFEAHLAAFREHLEVEVGRLTSAAQQLSEQRGWWDNPQQVRWLNRMLDLCHWYLLSARVMLTQHSAALHALEQQTARSGSSGSGSGSGSGSSGGSSGSGSGSGGDGSVVPSKSPSSSSPAAAGAGGDADDDSVAHYHEPGHQATVADQPYTPPHQALTDDTSHSLITRHMDVRRMLDMVIEDCRAFCVEKNSAAPDVQVSGGEGLRATMVVPYVEFVMTEVLKNALQAVVSRYGAWEVDDAPAVCVQVAELAGSSSPGASTLVSGTTSGSSAAGPAAAGSAPAAAAAAAACASAPVAAAAAAGASARGSSFQIRITDWGNGIPPSQFANMFSFFYTSARPASTLYGYSRNHGSTFQGQGVGVPMARVYAHFMGGSIEWETDAWRRHTTVTITLPLHGFTF